MNNQPYIFDIKRGSLDDGPGIRTVVFLKGCPLHCLWCHNPESNSSRPQLLYDRERCIGCGWCVSACKKGALLAENRMVIDRAVCDCCGACAKKCPTNALETAGRLIPIEKLLEILFRDETYYRESGGGVTFSGGEPLLYPEYVGGVAKALYSRGISTAVETCGQFDQNAVMSLVFPYVSEILFDIKLIDSGAHRRFTGVDNSLILENLRFTAAISTLHITPRTPMIPGITDKPENLAGIKSFLRKIGLESRHQLLPFHNGGAKKREKLNMPQWNPPESPKEPPALTKAPICR